MEQPKISVIIPAFNAEKYIGFCLDDLAKQSFKEFETIVVNDGSNDQTQRILEKYKNKLTQLIIITQNNQGLSASRNNAIDHANGQYICFVDADDRIAEDYLERMYATVSDSKSDIGIANITRVYENKKIKGISKGFKYIKSAETDSTVRVFDKPEILTQIQNSAFAKIISREFLLKTGIRFCIGRIYEDLLFTQQLLLSDPLIKITDYSGYMYYIHDNSLMTSKTSRIDDIFYIFSELCNFAKDKDVYLIFHQEIEFLAYYHIGIGTAYRYYKSEQMIGFKGIRKCREYLFENGFYIEDNKYLKRMQWYVKLYLNIMYRR